jgi:hypothetical protein
MPRERRLDGLADVLVLEVGDVRSARVEEADILVMSPLGGAGSARSALTTRRTYSANDTPSSAARCVARVCVSASSVIWVRTTIVAST